LALFCASGSVTIHQHNDEDIVAVDELMYCIKFLADEEKSNQDQEISQELTNLYEELKEMHSTETFVTRGMVVSTLSWQALWEKESKEH